MQDILQSFLEIEISDQEYYDGIIRFIYSGNIRCGEYECNEFVVKKIDFLNFIVFDEYEINKKKKTTISFSISKDELIKSINDFAEKQGFLIRDSHWN
ncbi:hypothetical protein [Bacillus alkalicellulosilyticus]|uniref:hypothetical protein n=1 Tax=Alkalihalobacterium alkalicellulosilyticum TaxID=1912214 RepID=UPI0009961024|nr:hypothetical protein [Bacillus alkalicellulosilyticus]